MILAIVVRLPFIPYNLRNLPNPFHPYAAPVVLAVFAYWTLGAPALTAQWITRSSALRIAFPVIAIFHGVLAWAIVRYAVLPEMLHKVTGTPIVGWSWEWETLGRFAVLEGALFFILTGAALIVHIRRLGAAGIRAWLIWAVLLLPIAFFVVITKAATDNLTELIAGSGSAQGCVTLALWILLNGAYGAAIARGLAMNRRINWSRAVLVVFAFPVGYLLVRLGTESALFKYGKVFSALQFLLSTDREHYATGLNLAFRYVAFQIVLIAAIALAQYVPWKLVSARNCAPPDLAPER
jgi:hypothetical protein